MCGTADQTFCKLWVEKKQARKREREVEKKTVASIMAEAKETKILSSERLGG